MARPTQVSTVGKEPDPFVFRAAGDCYETPPARGCAPRVVAVGATQRGDAATHASRLLRNKSPLDSRAGPGGRRSSTSRTRSRRFGIARFASTRAQTPTPRPTISSLPTYVRIRADLKSSTFSVKGSAPTRWCRACSPILQRPACVCSLGSCGCSVLPSTSRNDVLLDLWTEWFEEAGALAMTVGLGYLQPGKTIVYYRSDGGCQLSRPSPSTRVEPSPELPLYLIPFDQANSGSRQMW